MNYIRRTVKVKVPQSYEAFSKLYDLRLVLSSIPKPNRHSLKRFLFEAGEVDLFWIRREILTFETLC